MPILDAEIVVPDGTELASGEAAQLAEAAAQVFDSPPGSTWVRVRTLAPSQYAENGGGPPEDVWPVFVTVLKAEVPPLGGLKDEARALAEAVGRVCQRPTENVHILYLPSARGRIAFGGNLLSD